MPRATMQQLKTRFGRPKTQEMSTGPRRRWTSRSGLVCVDRYPRRHGHTYYVQQQSPGPQGKLVWELVSKHQAERAAFQVAYALERRLSKAR